MIEAKAAITDGYGNLTIDTIEVYPTQQDEVLVENRERLPDMRFDCGTDDGLIEDNRDLNRNMLAMGIDDQYEEFSGGHTWPYWNEHINDTLRFFGEIARRNEYHT